MERTEGGYPSGRWRGYYVQDGYRGWMSLGLTFEGGRVGGAGDDRVGPFVVAGAYVVAGVVRFLKQYVAAHAVDYEGGPSGSGVAGRWSTGTGGGTFRIWPCTDAEADEELVEQGLAESAYVRPSITRQVDSVVVSIESGHHSSV